MDGHLHRRHEPVLLLVGHDRGERRLRPARGRDRQRGQRHLLDDTRNRVVDNTAPTASDVQTTNVGGGTLGRPENGDTVTFTYSEQIPTTSILAGWNGTATAVTVRINNQGGNDRLEVWDAANTAKLPLTSTFLGLNNNYVTGDSTFNGTMVQAGASITITPAP